MGRISHRKCQLREQASKMAAMNTKKRILRKRVKVKKIKKAKKIQYFVVSQSHKRRPPPNAATVSALRYKRVRNRWVKLRKRFNLQQALLNRVSLLLACMSYRFTGEKFSDGISCKSFWMFIINSAPLFTTIIIACHERSRNQQTRE